MIQFQENAWTEGRMEGWKDGQTLFYRTLPATAGGPINTLRIASLNVGLFRGLSSVVIETKSRRGIDLCCIQECRWRGVSARMVEYENCRYKYFSIGSKLVTGGVAVLSTEKWIDKMFSVKRVSDHLMMIKMIDGEVVVTLLFVYFPQTRLTIAEKDLS